MPHTNFHSLNQGVSSNKFLARKEREIINDTMYAEILLSFDMERKHMKNFGIVKDSSLGSKNI